MAGWSRIPAASHAARVPHHSRHHHPGHHPAPCAGTQSTSGFGATPGIFKRTSSGEGRRGSSRAAFSADRNFPGQASCHRTRVAKPGRHCTITLDHFFRRTAFGLPGRAAPGQAVRGSSGLPRSRGRAWLECRRAAFPRPHAGTYRGYRGLRPLITLRRTTTIAITSSTWMSPPMV